MSIKAMLVPISKDEQPALKVGDRVRVTYAANGNRNGHFFRVGEEGTVVAGKVSIVGNVMVQFNQLREPEEFTQQTPHTRTDRGQRFSAEGNGFTIRLTA